MFIQKYKADQFDKIFYQDNIKNVIINLVKYNNLPNLLLYGNSGVGKTSIALSLANHLYGEDIDMMTLTLNSSNDRGIAIIKNIVTSFIETKAFISNKKKLVIFDEVDATTLDSQSMLRKLMEDYSNNVIFCLICNSIEKVIPALISRCMSFRIKQISYNNLKTFIKYIATKENIDINDKQCNVIAKYCEGDMRKVLNIMQSYDGKLDILNDETIIKILNIIKNNKLNKSYKIIENIINKRYDIEILIKSIHNYIIDNCDIYDSNKLINYFLDIGEIELQNIYNSTVMYYFITILKYLIINT